MQSMSMTVALEKSQVSFAVGVIEKNARTPVAAMGDVIGYLRNHDTCKRGHTNHIAHPYPFVELF